MAHGVEIKNVKKSYDKKVVLNDLSFSVNPGEFLVLVGPSGCGKSTMLRAIAGLEDVDTGEIYIGEKNVTEFAPKDRHIAMVFQDYALYPHKSVFENIAFGLRIRKFPEAEIKRRVEEAAKKLNLSNYLTRRPSALSGGQRQRVAIGRAIVREPHVFLFDEPLSNLDAKLRGSMRVEISKLHKELGATIIYVTHDQIEAMTLADRIVVLHAGKIQQMGPPLDLYYYPANIFVATFIGSPPMNIIEGRIEMKSQNEVRFVSNNGLVFPFPPAILPRLKVRDGEKVVWGIRSENLVLLDKKQKNIDFVCEAHVLLTEPLGSTTSVHCTVKGHDLQISIPEPSRPLRGDKLKLTWWAEHVYLFDAETQENLLRRE